VTPTSGRRIDEFVERALNALLNFRLRADDRGDVDTGCAVSHRNEKSDFRRHRRSAVKSARGKVVGYQDFRLARGRERTADEERGRLRT
jgi:hypothetical protein